MQEASRILVVEDDPLLRMLIVDVLTEHGHQVLEASNGEDAIALLNNPDHVSLVLTDLNMPGVDGMAVALHCERHRPGLPVILMSGRSDLLSAFPFECRYLQKPFSLDFMSSVVEEMLGGPSSPI